MRRFCLLVMLCCIPFIFLSPVMAQNNASIVGIVTDPSGAAMPNVKIIVTNRAQGLERSTVSDSVGSYKVGFLTIGTYTLLAEAPGFQKFLQTDIKIEIGQVQRADIVMQVGTTTQEITVTGNIVKVQTDESVLSSVIAGNQIANININGRNFVALSTLVPGASVTNSYDPTQAGQNIITNVNFNGTSYAQADWQADGGNLYNWNANGNFHGVPSLDSIAEFKISTSNYTADQGIRLGAVVEMSTKSGTRDIHGSMYEYVRNQAFDANGWFADQQKWSGLPAADCAGGNNVTGPCNAPKTPLKLNDFGFTIGGPFEIPGHYNTDRSKTFVFWSSEWKRIVKGTTISGQAPTARMRIGDFSECDNNKGFNGNYNALISGCVVPKDPATGKLYTEEGNGLVPVASQASILLNTWVPPPNNGPVGWIESPGVPQRWNQQLLRVDQNFGQNTRIYVRVSRDQDFSTTVVSQNQSSTYDTVQAQGYQNIYNWAGHLTHTFSPTVMNDFIYHYDDKTGPVFNVPGPEWTPSVLTRPAGFQQAFFFPANASLMTMLPGIYVSGGGVNFQQDWGTLTPNQGLEWNEQYGDNLAITRGKHNLKMGIMYIRGGTHSTLVQPGTGEAEGQFTFSSSSSVTTGNGLADMQLGRISQYLETSANDNGTPIGGYFGSHWYITRIEPYIQDDWRVNRRLTLNLGVRAFYLIPWQDQAADWNEKIRGYSVSFIAGFYPSLYNKAQEAPLNAADQVVRNYATGQTFDAKQYGNGLVHCGQGGIPAGCQFTNGAHFAPRFGFAYQPFSSPNTVIRGGYGVFYDQLTGNDTNPKNIGGNAPVYLTSTATNTVGYGSISPAGYGPASLVMLNPTVPYPMAQEFSLGVQREMKGNNRIAINYVGTLVKHNPRSISYNRVSDGATTQLVPGLAGKSGCDSSGNCDVQSNLIHGYNSINFFRPYEGYTTISERETTASSNYQALQAELRHPVGHGLTLEAAYTYSKWMDDADSYSGDPNIDDDHLNRYWARSGWNRTNVVSLQYVYDLPFLKNNGNHYVKNAFGGWQITGVTSFFSGNPVNFGCSLSGAAGQTDPNGIPVKGTGTGAGAMCNSLAPVVISKGVDNNPNLGPVKSWYNANNVGQLQYSQLAANGQTGMDGYMGINQLTGPGRNNFDLALLKNFNTPWFKGEHGVLQFRWETYNTFNHPQWQGINAGCDSNTPLGQSCGYLKTSSTTYNLGRGDVTSAWPNRVLQFGLKLSF